MHELRVSTSQITQLFAKYCRGELSNNDVSLGKRALKSAHKVYFVAYLNLDRHRLHEDMNSIRLFRVAEDKSQAVFMQSLPAAVDVEAVQLTDLKMELDRLERTRMGLSKRASLLSTIHSDIVGLLGDHISTLRSNHLNLNSISDYKGKLERSLADLTKKVEKLSEERDGLLEQSKE